MLEIVVGDIFCEVVRPREHLKELGVIRNVCRARPNGYQFMPRYKRGIWDGYISIMGGFSSYPTGLYHSVNDALFEAGYEPEYKGKVFNLQSDTHAGWGNDLDGITLRDYQIDAIYKLLNAGRGIAKMATNSGKTEVMAGIIKALNFPKTLVFVHRKELLHQTAERFEKRLGIKVGKIGDSIYNFQDVTVVMIQTFYRCYQDFPISDNKVVMVDECHTASSDTYMDCLGNIPGSYRFGFSGTPLKQDTLMDLKLIAMTGPVEVEVTNKELIDGEYSARPEVKIIRLKGSDTKSSYAVAYDDLIVNSVVRNSLIAKTALNASGTVLVLVNRLDHGNVLNDIIPNSTFVHGSHSTEHRKEILDSMRSGAGGIFIASPIFDEGVDIPALDCVILAGGGKSHVKLLQRIGRGLRKKSGENKLLVYDFDDNTNKYLRQHSKRRQEAYKDEQFDVEFI